jgi:adenosylmethionine-8-amino-7-oxononanoate aminotransferase
MSTSPQRERLQVDRRHLLHSQHHPDDHRNPHVWTSGEGVYLIDWDGRRYIDGLSGMWNVHLGHGRRELIDAATQQLARLPFATTYAGATSLPAIELARRLCKIVYPGIEAFFFTSGGAEATDTTIRTARYYWRALGRPNKTKIISRELSYHGSTVAAASATGVPEFSDVFGPRLPGFLHIDSPYPYRFNQRVSGQSQGRTAADRLEAAILREGPDTVAAFLAEPIQGGGGGVLVPQDDYFPRIREICDRYDVLLVSDDIITGFGRTGKWFGLEHWGVVPDIVQFAKGITSGYFPLGGIGVSAGIKAVLDSASPSARWWHGYTYSGHPVGCAIALATLDVIEREHLVDRAAALGLRLLQGLSVLEDHPNVGEIRGLGLLAGIEFVADRTTKERFDPKQGVGSRLREALLQRGLCTRVLSNAICLAPPLIATEAELDSIVEIVVSAIRDTFDR